MLVNLRLQLRVLYEKQRNLTNKLENSEQKAKQREEQILARDQEIMKMQQQIANLKREVNLENVRLNLKLKETKHAAEKEKIEMKNKMEKAEAEFRKRKISIMNAYFESKQEIVRLRSLLEESVRETSVVTDSFKTFYNEYLKLENDLSDIEKEMIPLQMQIYELAKAMNIEPEELRSRLEQLKIALTSDESVGNLNELLAKTLLDVDKDEVTPKDDQVASTSGGSSASASFNDTQPGSSSNMEQSDPSCPFSQKVLPEQLDNPCHKEAGKKHEAERGRMLRLKLGFKIPHWPLRQRSPW